MTWVCTCGFKTADGTKAFTHRDGTTFHQVTPKPVDGKKK